MKFANPSGDPKILMLVNLDKAEIGPWRAADSAPSQIISLSLGIDVFDYVDWNWDWEVLDRISAILVFFYDILAADELNIVIFGD